MKRSTKFSLSVLMAVAAACGQQEKKPVVQAPKLDTTTADTAALREKEIERMIASAKAADSVFKYLRQDIHRYIHFASSTLEQKVNPREAKDPEVGMDIIDGVLVSLKNKPLPAAEVPAVLDSLQRILRLQQPLAQLSKGDLTSAELARMLANVGNTQIPGSIRRVINEGYESEIKGGEVKPEKAMKLMRERGAEMARGAGIQHQPSLLVDGFVKLAIHLALALEKENQIKVEMARPLELNR